jgi:hypothetical protein
MLKKSFFGALTPLIVGFVFVFGLIGCDDGADGNGGKGGGSIPSELVGEWAAKANPSEMLFKITSDGTFTSTGQSGGNFDKISVSGKTVEIKTSGTTVAAFDYSVSGGEMAISNATSFMAGIALLSPFVKVGSNSNSGGNNNGGSNGGSLSAIAGKWYKANQLAFEITSAGKLIMTDNTSYDISVSGSTATLKFGGTTVGTFDYAVSSGQMLMFNGTAIGLSIVALSPVGKTSSGGNVTPIDPPINGGEIDNPINGGDNPGGNDSGSVQSFSFPSQLKNTWWWKDGTTQANHKTKVEFRTDSIEFASTLSGTPEYPSTSYVDSMTGNTYHFKSGGAFTATVNGNQLTLTGFYSSNKGTSWDGTYTKGN